ncbi:MAG: hypothetical protein Q9174_006254 [Haloplaca sp. 1 TL-2023]
MSADRRLLRALRVFQKRAEYQQEFAYLMKIDPYRLDPNAISGFGSWYERLALV